MGRISQLNVREAFYLHQHQINRHSSYFSKRSDQKLSKSLHLMSVLSLFLIKSSTNFKENLILSLFIVYPQNMNYILYKLLLIILYRMGFLVQVSIALKISCLISCFSYSLRTLPEF
jgi:hypothetical protein